MSFPSSITAEAPPASTACRVATGELELAAHHELRRRVFVEEQGLFAHDDRDERDGDPGTVRVVGFVDGEPCGAVRLYPLDPAAGLWKGDRLAVTREQRAHHLGASLVRFAVATAGELGGRRMIAHIQLSNVRFFEHLGWTAEGDPAPFHGRPHQPMSIALSPRPDA